MRLISVGDVNLTDSPLRVEAQLVLETDFPFAELSKISKGIKQGKKYSLEIKAVHDHRSLNANAYAWVLMQKIAEKLGITKEEVYRQNVQSYGTFTCITLQNNALDSFRKIWTSNGLGWQVEVMGQTFGYVDVMAYPGTSTYDSKQMARFIDGLIADCKDLEIETLPPDLLAGMVKEWGK